MPRERDVSEQERLDRIERYISQLAEASAALQKELKISRQLAGARARAVMPVTSARARRPTRKRR